MFWNALISRAECFWTRSCKSLIRSHHCRHRDLDDVIAILMTSSRLFHPFQRQEIPQRRLKRKRKHNLEVVLWVCRIRVEGFFRYKSQTRFKRNFFLHYHHHHHDHHHSKMSNAISLLFTKVVSFPGIFHIFHSFEARVSYCCRNTLVAK